MKKLLLSTSAIVGVGLMAAPSMAAEKIKLAVGGYMEQYVGYADSRDHKVGNITVYDFAKVDTQSDSEVYFTGSTKLDNGITLSVVVELEADVGAGGAGSIIDESYLRVVSPTLGELRVGGEDSVDALMVVQANRGISADYDNWVVETNMTKNDNLYDGASSDANKISYFTPKIAGFQVGASYAPNSTTAGSNVDPANYASETGASYAVAATYETKLADVGVKLGASMHQLTHGTAYAAGRRNYTGGAILDYMGFSVSGGYARTMEKVGTVATESVDGHRYQVGLQYVTGPYTMGVWHMKYEHQGDMSTAKNNRDHDQTKVYTAYGEYAVSDGVKLQGLIFKVDYDNEEGAGTGSTTATANNDGGWGVVTGFRLDF